MVAMHAVGHQAILFIYERVDFLFVILFTVVGAIELSVDQSFTFFFWHFFIFVIIFCWMHSAVFYLEIDSLWLELSNCQ